MRTSIADVVAITAEFWYFVINFLVFKNIFSSAWKIGKFVSKYPDHNSIDTWNLFYWIFLFNSFFC